MRLLTIKKVAECLAVSESFVYALLASGRLRHHVLGAGQGGKRISEEQIADYLRQTERGGKERESAKPPQTKFKHLKFN